MIGVDLKNEYFIIKEINESDIGPIRIDKEICLTKGEAKILQTQLKLFIEGKYHIKREEGLNCPYMVIDKIKGCTIAQFKVRDTAEEFCNKMNRRGC